MNNENKTIRSVALYRLLAMLLVVSGHLITVATYSYEIVDVISGPLSSPILPDNGLAHFDVFLATYLHTNSGSLAVVMFFIASDYLISRMMSRYNVKEFIINRVLSVFPTLWASLILVALFVYLSQGIVYSPADFLGSMFPFWPRITGTFVTLVLWTLRIEIKFYLLAALFWGKRKELIIYGYLIIFLAGFIYYEYRSPWIYTQMYDLSFMCFAYLGVLIETFEREKQTNGHSLMGAVSVCILINLLLFKASVNIFHEDRGFYQNCGTHIFPTAILLLFMSIERRAPKVFQRIPNIVYSVSKLSMPVYCTHVGCGLTVMYWLSKAGCGVIVTLLGGWVTAFFVAVVIYVLVTRPSGVLMKKIIRTMRKEQ